MTDKLKITSVKLSLVLCAIIAVLCFVALVRVEMMLKEHKAIIDKMQEKTECIMSCKVKMETYTKGETGPLTNSSKKDIPKPRLRRDINPSRSNSDKHVLDNLFDSSGNSTVSQLRAKQSARANNVCRYIQYCRPWISNHPPKVSLPVAPIYVRQGSNVTLPACNVIGYPKPKVTWSKLMSSLPAKRVLMNGNKLKFFSVAKEDSGWYVCTASNYLGSTMGTVRVNVVDVQFALTPPLKVKKYAGENLTLNCRAVGDPPMKITWRKEAGQLSFASYKTRVYSYGTLNIRRLKATDQGKYVCRAEIGGMVAVETVTMVIIEKNSNKGLKFPRESTTDYVKIRRRVPSMSVFTLCLWMKTSVTIYRDRTMISYATPQDDNEIWFYASKYLQIYMGRANLNSGVRVNDDKWHHVCATWEKTAGRVKLYKDGVRIAQGSLKKGHVLRGGGSFIIGQEQERVGGSFDAKQAYIGELTGINMWNRVLGASEISAMSKSCGDASGNVLTWRDVMSGNKYGHVQVMKPSGCKSS